MDCQFCNVERATHFRVPTRYGVAAGLCPECYARYLARPRKAGRTMNVPINETSGPAKAAHFSDSIPPDPQSQEVTQCRNQV